ncbi:hypothetical protein EDC96DRAFT_570178 [Choanephora cucurbitarum]|nr:hypothetical protein EDC96DRAFT_570178 [Choanephora cucurbitarum]
MAPLLYWSVINFQAMSNIGLQVGSRLRYLCVFWLFAMPPKCIFWSFIVEVAFYKPGRTKLVIALQLSVIETTNLHKRVCFFGLPCQHVDDIPMSSCASSLIDPIMPIPVATPSQYEAFTCRRLYKLCSVFILQGLYSLESVTTLSAIMINPSNVNLNKSLILCIDCLLYTFIVITMCLYMNLLYAIPTPSLKEYHSEKTLSSLRL